MRIDIYGSDSRIDEFINSDFYKTFVELLPKITKSLEIFFRGVNKNQIQKFCDEMETNLKSFDTNQLQTEVI